MILTAGVFKDPDGVRGWGVRMKDFPGGFRCRGGVSRGTLSSWRDSSWFRLHCRSRCLGYRPHRRSTPSPGFGNTRLEGTRTDSPVGNHVSPIPGTRPYGGDEEASCTGVGSDQVTEL